MKMADNLADCGFAIVNPELLPEKWLITAWDGGGHSYQVMLNGKRYDGAVFAANPDRVLVHVPRGSRDGKILAEVVLGDFLLQKVG